MATIFRIGWLALALPLAGLVVVAVAAGVMSVANPAPTVAPDRIEVGDCVFTTGPTDDVTLTEVACDSIKAIYVVDALPGTTNPADCPSTSDAYVRVTNSWLLGETCLSILPGRNPLLPPL